MHFVTHKAACKTLGVHWRVWEIAADLFVKVRTRALLAAEGRTPSEPDTPLEGEFFARCDYNFMMGFKSPANSGLLPEQTREGQMSRNGVMPLGIAPDTELGSEAVYVMVKGEHRPAETPPFLSGQTWAFLTGILGAHSNNRHIVLLGVRNELFERALNYVYYQIDIPKENALDLSAAGSQPLSINVQQQDPPEIAKARYWLRIALERRASDVHLEPGDGRGRLRLRVDGELIEDPEPVPVHMLIQVITWIKAQAQMDISEKRLPQDGSIRLSYAQGKKQRTIDVRVSTMPTIYGQKMVMRLLDPASLSELAARGLAKTITHPEQCKQFEEVMRTRDGIVLVTGPTGSGKTTTLNAALYHLLSTYGASRNIISIEDPVEYNVPGINQVQVNERAGMTFARILRSILRQDPDIVLVGEIRDAETAQIAVQASLTGHLILSTLHTNDAIGAIDRLMDLGASPFLVGSTVRLLQAQRLVRRLCERCGRKSPLSRADLERRIRALRLDAYADRLLDSCSTVFDPTGCDYCDRTGFSGRAAVMEMVAITPQIIRAIEQRVPRGELLELARRHGGYRPMIEYGLDMVCRGETALVELEAIRMNAAAEALDVGFPPPPDLPETEPKSGR